MKYDVIVVGGGPAGMTAAIYALRAGRSVLLLEGASFGGQIVNSQLVENYPGTPDIGGWELADRMVSQLRALNAETQSARVSGMEKNADGSFSVRTEKGDCFDGRTVILATGVGHRKLGVAGEEALIGRGVSFCATCDGMFFRRREVAVVGGGNTAVQDALVLAEFCSKVYLIHRREGFRAEDRLMERMRQNEKIEIITDTVVDEMRGAGRLESLLLRNLKTGAARELAVAGVFEAIGNLPQNAAFSNLVALDEEGYILADDDCRTSCEGIFAAGDCRRKRVRQLTTATADGTVAALSAVDWIG